VNRKLDSITSERAADYGTYLQTKGRRPSSVNSSLRVLRRALRLAVEWGIISAAPKIQLLRGEHHRERIVLPEEEARYLGAAGELMADIATVLRYGDATGGELPASLGVYGLVEWTVRNATGDARQDGRSTADASLESACAVAPRAALGASEEVIRRLGMGDGNGKRTPRAFHG
jgi:hypothetical protein